MNNKLYGNLIFEFDEKDYIDVPEIKSDDPELLEHQKHCQEYLNQKITYLSPGDYQTQAQGIFHIIARYRVVTV